MIMPFGKYKGTEVYALEMKTLGILYGYMIM
jgi:uncharacterized protein (DUF3820 family)